MNHAPGKVTPLNPEMVQVGGAVGQLAQWRGLLEGAVRPVGIVKVLVLPQHYRKGAADSRSRSGPAAHVGSCQSTAP